MSRILSMDERRGTKRKQTTTVGKRKKIEMKYVRDKSRRQAIFTKRKNGIMKKAHELTILTGCELLLLMVNENGNAYTFCTNKFLPFIEDEDNKKLIQDMLSTGTAKVEKLEEVEESKETGMTSIGNGKVYYPPPPQPSYMQVTQTSRDPMPQPYSDATFPMFAMQQYVPVPSGRDGDYQLANPDSKGFIVANGPPSALQYIPRYAYLNKDAQPVPHPVPHGAYDDNEDKS